MSTDSACTRDFTQEIINCWAGRPFAHNRHGPKVERGCCRGLGPPLTQCGLSPGLPLHQVASWSIQPFGHTCRNATLLRVGIRLRTIFIPSLVVTDRQTGQKDNRPVAYGEPFYKRSPKKVTSQPLSYWTSNKIIGAYAAYALMPARHRSFRPWDISRCAVSGILRRVSDV